MRHSWDGGQSSLTGAGDPDNTATTPRPHPRQHRAYGIGKRDEIHPNGISIAIDAFDVLHVDVKHFLERTAAPSVRPMEEYETGEYW
jgi:hypothetical protein